MELHVESAGVTDGLSLGVSAPERGCRGVAVGTREADAAGSRLRENAEEESTSALRCYPQQHLQSQRAPAHLRFSSPLPSLISQSFSLFTLLRWITQLPFSSPLVFHLTLHCLPNASHLPVLCRHLSAPGASQMVPEISPELSPRSPAGPAAAWRPTARAHTYTKVSGSQTVLLFQDPKPFIFQASWHIPRHYQCHESYVFLAGFV